MSWTNELYTQLQRCEFCIFSNVCQSSLSDLYACLKLEPDSVQRNIDAYEREQITKYRRGGQP